MKAPTALPVAEGRDDWRLEVAEPILPGLYAAVITSVELRTSEDGREWLAWGFTLSDDGRLASGGSSFSISPRSKSYAWIAAVLGRRRMGGGAVITAVELIGQACTVSIVEDAEGFSKVDAVLPPQGGHPTPEDPRP
jgi:hypothetical protein